MKILQEVEKALDRIEKHVDGNDSGKRAHIRAALDELYDTAFRKGYNSGVPDSYDEGT